MFALLEDSLAGLVGLLLSNKANIQQQVLTLTTTLFDCSSQSKEAFRVGGGISSLLSIAASRSGRHLLALQALAKLAEVFIE